MMNERKVLATRAREREKVGGERRSSNEGDEGEASFRLEDLQ
jgi:hypothetical protein